MHIIFFTHPSFLPHQSMPRYASWLAEGMKKRGHTVELWTAKPQFFALPVPASFRKWMGYIDQFLMFPMQVKRRLKTCPADTVFVVTDHALGPWVPLVAGKKHVIHCHDFLAQRSALGQLPENRVSKSGQKYQEFIRNGFRKGRNFISVSRKTQSDLHEFLQKTPDTSEVVYNGVNNIYKVTDATRARTELGKEIGLDLSAGYILHVGGNQWYKNREGVVSLYDAWRKSSTEKLPLLLIGEKPSESITALSEKSAYSGDIRFIQGLSDNMLVNAYNGATVFVFPSLAEGFGWPIAEAMTCGCPVITTNEAPMNEVGSDAAIYVRRKPSEEDIETWSAGAASVLNEVLHFSTEKRAEIISKGLQNVRRFESEKGLDQIEAVYKKILKEN